MQKLRFYNTLSADSRDAFLDCCAYWASVNFGFVVRIPRSNPTSHPFFSRWSEGPRWFGDFGHMHSVPLLRSMIQQYKMDRANKVPSHITKRQFEYACSVRSLKAPELRRRVLAALKPFGYSKTDEWGNYWCRVGKQRFFVHLDFCGRLAQLQYSVGLPEFRDSEVMGHLGQFAFEQAMGFGFGKWNYIVEENADDAFELFGEVVRYSLELPDRMRDAMRRRAKPGRN